MYTPSAVPNGKWKNKETIARAMANERAHGCRFTSPDGLGVFVGGFVDVGAFVGVFVGGLVAVLIGVFVGVLVPPDTTLYEAVTA